MKKLLCNKSFIIALMTSQFLCTPLFAHIKPPLDQLDNAKARVQNCIQMVSALINKIDDYDNGDDRPHRPPHDPNGPNGPGGDNPPWPENDPLARRLLVRINLSLEDLAIKMDEATAVYDNDFLFWPRQHIVCHQDHKIYDASQGAKSASLLPRVGLMTPADMDPIDEELFGIQNDFGCN